MIIYSSILPTMNQSFRPIHALSVRYNTWRPLYKSKNPKSNTSQHKESKKSSHNYIKSEKSIFTAVAVGAAVIRWYIHIEGNANGSCSPVEVLVFTKGTIYAHG